MTGSKPIFMKSLSCLLVLLCMVLPVPAQQLQRELDSLSRLIEAREIPDTTSVDLRNLYAKKALFAQPSDSGLLDFGQKTLELAKILDYGKGILMAHERLALIHQYSFSNPYKAQEAYHSALSVMEGDSSLKASGWSIYGGIGTLYYEQEEYDKALDYFKRVLANDSTLELTATANMANIYGSLGQLDSAIYYYNRALKLEMTKENPTYRANLYSNLALIYGQAGKKDSALASAKKSLALIGEYGIEFVRPTAYANASMAYLWNGDFDRAEHYAKEALELSEASGNLFLQRSAWGTLADLYTAREEYPQALEAYKKFSAFKDSLNGQNRRVEVNRKQMEFDFERERAMAQQEIGRQSTIKRASLIGGGGLLLASALAFVLYKRRRDALEQKKEAEFRALVSETELKALRAQMSPHFIFNSLNSIGDYILKNDTETALDYLGKFAKLVRKVLENSEFREIPLEDELHFIELYLQVETKRQPGRFTHTIQVERELVAEQVKVPPLILQPFIENSIWHGFTDKAQKGHLLVDIRKKDGMLVCSVEDDGVGRQSLGGRGSDKRSYGLAITRSRLEVINGQGRGGATLEILDRPKGRGTRVAVILPYEPIF